MANQQWVTPTQLDPTILRSAAGVLTAGAPAGTLAARPAAGTARLLYFATDVLGGALYRDTGAAWVPVSIISGSGTLAARPAASADNAGGQFLATDVMCGALYRSTGAAWVLISVQPTVDTAETTFTGTGQAAATEVILTTYGTIKANAWQAGMVLCIDDFLAVSTINDATARTMRMRLRVGGIAGAIVADTGSFAVKVLQALTNLPWPHRITVACRTGGAAGVLVGGGGISPFRGWNSNLDIPDPWSQAFVTPAVDLTVDQSVVLTTQESVNTVADTVKHEYSRMGF